MIEGIALNIPARFFPEIIFPEKSADFRNYYFRRAEITSPQRNLCTTSPKFNLCPWAVNNFPELIFPEF